MKGNPPPDDVVERDPRKPYVKPTLTRIGTLDDITKAFSGGSRVDRFARRGGVFKFPFRR